MYDHDQYLLFLRILFDLNFALPEAHSPDFYEMVFFDRVQNLAKQSQLLRIQRFRQQNFTYSDLSFGESTNSTPLLVLRRAGVCYLLVHHLFTYLILFIDSISDGRNRTDCLLEHWNQQSVLVSVSYNNNKRRHGEKTYEISLERAALVWFDSIGTHVVITRVLN